MTYNHKKPEILGKKSQESDTIHSNHGRNEQGLGSHRPYAGSTLAGETDTRTRVATIKYPKSPNREVALEASRGRIRLKLEHNVGPFRWNQFFEGYF